MTQVLPVRQVGTTSTMGFSFRKVGFILIVYLGVRLIYSGLKGSLILVDAWYVGSSNHTNINLRYLRAILHNPEIYPDPEEFKPERFLNPDGIVRDDPTLSLLSFSGKLAQTKKKFKI